MKLNELDKLKKKNFRHRFVRADALLIFDTSPSAKDNTRKKIYIVNLVILFKS